MKISHHGAIDGVTGIPTPPRERRWDATNPPPLFQPPALSLRQAEIQIQPADFHA